MTYTDTVNIMYGKTNSTHTASSRTSETFQCNSHFDNTDVDSKERYTKANNDQERLS